VATLITASALTEEDGVAERMADIEQARAAVACEDWTEAYEAFSAVDPSSYTPEDWRDLAQTAWWLGKADESLAARQRGYTGFAAAGDEASAGWAAGLLCIEHFLREEPAVGAGWLARAQRHARAMPDCIELGWAALLEATVARFGGDVDSALPLVERATQFGERFGDRDLLGMAIHTHGMILIGMGRVPEGVAMLDEAMTSVIAGELSNYYTGAVYCNVIEACLSIADVGRAAEWSVAAQAWADSMPQTSPFPGICRINRATIANLRGEWPQAEAEALRAAEELSFSPSLHALALYEMGDVRRRVGDLAGAEEAFEHAHALGMEPQPGLALLRLAQGKVDAAMAALRVATTGGARTPLAGSRLLWALADAALAAGDLETARTAAGELSDLAGAIDAPVLAASAATVEGSSRLADSDVPGALESLRRACATWQDLKLPYEAARARMLYGLALRAAGDEDDARLELRAALSAFERLGAAADAVKTSDLLAPSTSLPRGLTPREAEVLRLVAAGKTNRDIAVELVISEHTVARHLQNMFVKLDVSSRSAATAFAYEHGLA
jgi:DNA-binding CsgD family transcriptional regulator